MRNWFSKTGFMTCSGCGFGLALLLCSEAAFAGAPAVAPTNSVQANANPKEGWKTAASATEYHIQVLDALQITVFQEPDLTQKVKVSQQGTISYPLLGSVSLEGLTVSEAEKKLTALLEKDYLVNPRVTIIVGSNSARRVIVLGQVKNPGAYELSSDEPLTLLQAIARSGGFTDLAARDRITIARPAESGVQKIVVNVSAIIKGSARNKDIELKPGDVVSVPETIF